MMNFVSRFKPRFTLSALLLAIAAISILLAWQVRRRAEAQRINGLRQRESYALRVLSQVMAHAAIAENEVLKKYRLHPSVPSKRSQSLAPGQFTFETEIHFSSYHERRAEWPVREIKQALLSSLVEVAKDMELISSVDVATVTPNCAVLAGDEGWIVWEFVETQTGLPSSRGAALHALEIEFKCRGRLTYDELLDQQSMLFKLGEDPQLALRSKSAEDRRAGAAHISIFQSRDRAEAVLAAIERETDPAVLSELYQSLELEQSPADGIDTLVLARLQQKLERDGPHAALAAQTILRGDQLLRLFNAQRDQASAAALKHLRRAGIELLKSGNSEHWTAAASELRRQMPADDQEAVEAIVNAIKSGQTDQHINVELYRALRGNPHAVDPLFVLLRESDRPEVWYPAAEILQASATFVDTKGEKVWDRVLGLSGRSKSRMQLVGSYSAGHKEELAVLGDAAFEFLIPFVEYPIWENVPPLYSRAADMLAKLGDRRAVPVLIRGVEDHFRHGQLEESSTAYGAAQLVKAINELTGENFGGLSLGLGVSGDEVEKCDWPEIRRALAEYPGT